MEVLRNDPRDVNKLNVLIPLKEKESVNCKEIRIRKLPSGRAIMTNILEGPHPDEMRPGETYRLVYKGRTRIGEVQLELKKVGK